MNLTFYSIHLISNLLHSPFLAQPKQFAISKNQFSHIYLTNSFSHFFFSNNPLNKLTISNSKFSFFLDTAVKIGETYVTNANLRFDRVSIYDTIFKCKDSVFRDCQCIFGNGGAIFSLSSTILRNCFFSRCQAEQGGAVYSGSDIDYFSTSFLNNIGYRSGGCVFVDHPERIIVSFCTFFRSISSNAGALMAAAEGSATFRYNNISGCGSMSSNGAFDLSFMNVEFYFALFDQCFAMISTAGILLYNNAGFSIASVLFIFLSVQENNQNEGAVLTIRNPTKNSVINHCSFSRTRKTSGYTIHVERSPYPSNPSSTNGGVDSTKNIVVRIINCCFTLPLNFEFDGKSVVSDNTSLVVLYNDNSSIIHDKCDTFIAFMIPRYMGYAADRVMTPIPMIDRIFDRNTVRFLSDNSLMIFIIGIVFGILFWMANYFMSRRGRRRRRERIRPEL